VHWVGSDASRAFYDRLSEAFLTPGAVFTLDLQLPLKTFYDRMRGVKGPSFGTRFTLLCPFMYLAHYDQVQSPEGRRNLLARGINPDLVRISVGCEPAEAIIEAFDEALSPA